MYLTAWNCLSKHRLTLKAFISLVGLVCLCFSSFASTAGLAFEPCAVDIGHTEVAKADTLPYFRKPAAHHDIGGLNRRDSAKQQLDLIDLSRRVFHPRHNKADSNTYRKPSRLHLSAIPAAGYTLQTGFAGILSGNAAFYTDDPEVVRLSTLSTSIEYTQKGQILFPIQASIWFDKNKYNFVTDWRLYQYPQSTFGLGGRSRASQEYVIQYNYLRLYTLLLRRIARNLYTGGGFDYDYYFNIKEVKPPRGITAFRRYGGGHYERSAGISLNLLFDSRHNPLNADNGYYLSMAYRDNFKTAGSRSNWSSFILDARKYVELESIHSILAFWNYDWFTVAGKPPFFNLPNTGGDTYNNTGRGYIVSRFRAQQMLYLESELRWTITRNGLFGAVAFANAQSFARNLRTEIRVINPAFGFGARIKLNKFSQTNIALDYGFGKHSQGVFVNLGEVF